MSFNHIFYFHIICTKCNQYKSTLRYFTLFFHSLKLSMCFTLWTHLNLALGTFKCPIAPACRIGEYTLEGMSGT